MKHAPSFIAISIVSAIMIAQTGYGRIGESYRQCVARYGKAVAALPGLGHIQGVAGFEKSGIAVTTLFDRPNKQCFLILYRRGRGENVDSMAVLSEAEIDSLMASIDTTWIPIEEDYAPPSVYRGYAYRAVSRADPTRFGGYVGVKATKSDQDKKSSSKCKVPAQKDWKERMMLAMSAARDFLDAIKYCSAAGFLKPGPELKPYRRSGHNLFAFKLGMGSCEGLLLINSDASKAISDWATAYKESLIPEKDRGRPLEGF